jgi:signal transduction histidine kinase
LSLFRTLQELLHNTAKHSHAKQVRVDLVGEYDLIRLRVCDDGIGFDTGQTKKGLGLVSIQERLRSVGGQFTIYSMPSRGTQIQATVPNRSRDLGSSIAS